MLPFASWLLYLGAIVSGAWYVVPRALYARTHRTARYACVNVSGSGWGHGPR